MLDLNGEGTLGDLLPGTKINQFKRGLGKDDLRRTVNEFNRIHAGGHDARGNFIPPITLPAKFELGDSFLTQDVRLSRDLVLHPTLASDADGGSVQSIEHWELVRLERRPAGCWTCESDQPGDSGVWFWRPSGIPNSGTRQFLISFAACTSGRHFR